MIRVPDNAATRPVVLGVSLKLYMNIAQSAQWARDVATIANGHPAIKSGTVKLFVLPSLPAVPAVSDALEGTHIRWGAQDLHWEDRGAFTGATSGADLREIGCSFVEVGHAERRNVFGEGDDVVKLKLEAAFRNGLTPVLCVGEREKMSAADAASACIAQLDSALATVVRTDSSPEIVVAYEPEWAIGAEMPASPDSVGVVAQALRDRLSGESWLGSSTVIYGGSAQRGTLTSLGNNIDGLFLGRFAHQPGELEHILDEAAGLR
ncbi:triosephosphate isomerase [Salinibacterium xinjiangense]|uniref:Triosephosphate isomerase n=1 Tax=Salinibacterium xinjiangense TaxID=386302 RepID=A0A2C9A0J0_9MICO|nr:triose-phosphate isomerase family protein [Salinibacterium xinjiangense]GGL03568.1 triosephosphate isomerase [Salinibacterium xinjiangense]SOE72415.1 triosephosphate isomerase [Salinibacterium xinjiangense]